MVSSRCAVVVVISLLVLVVSTSCGRRCGMMVVVAEEQQPQPQQPPPQQGIDCATVTALISACSSFVMYGSPDPIPGSPCCTAMLSMSSLADSTDNRQTVCRCMMDLITTYNPNATSIATLPGFCGVSLGFIIDPNTDCEYIG